MINFRIKPLFAACLGLCAVISLSGVILAQESREESVRAIEAKLFDASSVPYQLRAMYNGRGFQFCNTSSVRVTGYRLGCVKRKKGELLILSERDFQAADLKPESGKLQECQLWWGNHGLFPLDECKEGKLAITEVALDDGAMWKLKP